MNTVVVVAILWFLLIAMVVWFGRARARLRDANDLHAANEREGKLSDRP